MSIDIAEAVKAIRDMAPIMDPDEDYLAIVAAEEGFAKSEAKRKKELDQLHANFKALSRILDAARASSTRPSTVPSQEAHTATLNQLDASRLSLVKAVTDGEGLLASKEAELAALKDEARRLEDYDPALDHESQLDGTALRLQIYRGLGFEPVIDKGGQLIKLLVRSLSGDIHAVALDPKQSNFQHTQSLWNLASL